MIAWEILHLRLMAVFKQDVVVHPVVRCISLPLFSKPGVFFLPAFNVKI